MSDFIDHLPSSVREGIRKKMRSPEAYERLREKVKGPEDLEKEMTRADRLAEFHLMSESDPAMKEKIKARIEKDMNEQGAESLSDMPLTPEQKSALEQGKFTVAISEHPSTHEDVMVIIPEGTVQEKIPLKTQFSDQYSGQQ